MFKQDKLAEPHKMQKCSKDNHLGYRACVSRDLNRPSVMANQEKDGKRQKVFCMNLPTTWVWSKRPQQYLCYSGIGICDTFMMFMF